MEKRPNILIIEPRFDLRTCLEMTLCHEGMRVFSALNLNSALLQLRVLRPDLIILGCACEELVASNAVAKIKALTDSPLLALGNGNDAALGSGFAGALTYPLGPKQLCAQVLALLDRPCSATRRRRWQATPGLSANRLLHDGAWTVGEEVRYEAA